MGDVSDTVGEEPDRVGEPRALEGTTLGAYRIEKLLGEGAMGEVFLATHVALGRPVALKTLKAAVAADRTLTERFFAEARAVNIIRHENIVECTDLVNDPSGRSYIVMELLEGKTLGDAIRETRRIPVERAARIVAQIADAIGAAHDKGIVHRDLKPENVYLIRRSGSTDYVKVLDFGIARLRPDLGGATATQSGALIGTPAYMSPEQVRGERVGPSADIYAVGVILFHMLTGRMPFAATSMSMMLVAQLQEVPLRVDKLVPELPKAMADLVERTLAKEVSARPADMATLRREVLEAAGLPSEMTPPVDSSSSLPVDPRVIASVSSAFDPTIAPGAIGQSSISAAAGEAVRKPRSRSWLYAGGGTLVVGGALIAMFTAGPWASQESTTMIDATPAPTPSPVTRVDRPVELPPAPAPTEAPAPAPTPMTPKPENHDASKAQRELEAARRELATSLQTLSDQHPTVRAAHARVTAAEERLRRAKAADEPKKPTLGKNPVSADQFKARMNAIAGRVQKACYVVFSEPNPITASVTVVVQPSGRVSSAVASGRFAGTEVGSCVSSWVKKVTFRPWAGEPQTFTHDFLVSDPDRPKAN